MKNKISIEFSGNHSYDCSLRINGVEYVCERVLFECNAYTRHNGITFSADMFINENGKFAKTEEPLKLEGKDCIVMRINDLDLDKPEFTELL